MAISKTLMFWLTFWLDHNTFPELLFWEDVTQSIFRICYCHGNKINRKLSLEETSRVWLEWDKKKDRPPCITGEDFTRSKLRFRQALSSLTDRGFLRIISSCKAFYLFQVVSDQAERKSGLIAGRRRRTYSTSSHSSSSSSCSSCNPIITLILIQPVIRNPTIVEDIQPEPREHLTTEHDPGVTSQEEFPTLEEIHVEPLGNDPMWSTGPVPAVGLGEYDWAELMCETVRTTISEKMDC